MRAAVWAGFALTLLVGAAGSAADPPLALDPSAARQGTTLLVTADKPVLAPRGQAGQSLTFALARGMRVDPASRQQLCSLRDAARAECPEPSRIGFGRFSYDVRGWDAGGGDSELDWSIDAFLGEPKGQGDPASVVLVARLLGSDLVGSLLAPDLGTSVPDTTTTVGRLVRVASGAYGVELRFDTLPVEVDVKPPVTATPSRLELSLSAVRRVRQNFTRRFRIKTPTGYEVRRVADHRLVGHYLLRTPSTCKGSWPAELRVGIPGGEQRRSYRLGCTKTLALG